MSESAGLRFEIFSVSGFAGLHFLLFVLGGAFAKGFMACRFYGFRFRVVKA